jgi:cysteinyl-tRNA synthetase
MSCTRCASSRLRRAVGQAHRRSRAGARVQVDEFKHDPLDFVVWKHAKPGEPVLALALGPGPSGLAHRMLRDVDQLLGDYFDLHGGGMDLKFPHHENEIAQSCAACDSPFVHVWMHNGFVNIDDEKMSKSLGNFFTVREVLKTLRDPEVLRFFLLSSHYRGPINYSAAQLAQADETLAGLYRALKDTPAQRPAAAAGSAGSDPALERFTRRWMMISTRPRRWRCLRAWRASSTSPRPRAMRAQRRGGALAPRDGQSARHPAAVARCLSQARRPSTGRGRCGRGGGGAHGCADRGTHRRAPRGARAKNFRESDRIRDRLSAAGIVWRTSRAAFRNGAASEAPTADQKGVWAGLASRPGSRSRTSQWPAQSSERRLIITPSTTPTTAAMPTTCQGLSRT